MQTVCEREQPDNCLFHSGIKQLGNGYQPQNNRRQAGFSLLEVLVVVGIIALLVSLVTVVAVRARTIAEKSSTQHLMSALATAINQFEKDMGYYPPLLTEDLTIPDAGNLNNFRDRRAMRYNSTLSLVPYLVGVGDLNRNGDETSDNLDDGIAGVGLRDPGADKSWGGATDATARETYLSEIENKRGLSGTVYGPYLEMGGKFDIAQAYQKADDTVKIEGAYWFSDWWERPIRYYQGWRLDPEWNKPGSKLYEIMFPEWEAAILPEQLENVKVALRSAPFVLLSAGPDMEASPDEKAKDKYPELDKDNLVEIGS